MTHGLSKLIKGDENMIPNIKKDKQNNIEMRCPKCDESLGRRPLEVQRCFHCGEKIDYSREFILDWFRANMNPSSVD